MADPQKPATPPAPPAGQGSGPNAPAPQQPSSASNPATTAGQAASKPAGQTPQSTTLGGGHTSPPTPLGAQQAHSSSQADAARSARPGDATVQSGTGEQVGASYGSPESEEAKKKYEEAKKKFDEAKAELDKFSAAPDTTAEDDAKQAQEFKAAAAQQRGVTISGRPGGPFNIDGEGFGDAKGEIRVGGRSLEVTRWNDRSIKGTLPKDVKPGPIELVTAQGATIGGMYGGTQAGTGQRAQVLVEGQVVGSTK